MLALVAVLLANADGRAGLFLAGLIESDRRGALILVAIFLFHAFLAALAGAIAHQMIGPGIAALMAGGAMLGAAASLLGAKRLASPAPAETRLRFAARLFFSQLGHRSHVLIAALAATSGAGIWAGAGGLIGWGAALLPFLAFGPSLAGTSGARLARHSGAGLLTLWGLWWILKAFGL